MKLKSNREYWNELVNTLQILLSNGNLIGRYHKQMQFTGQEPKLEMFVNLLEKPIKPLSPASDDQWDSWQKAREKYQQAEDKILFKGFSATKVNDYYIIKDEFNTPKWVSWNKSDTIELFVGCELTKNGQKQIGYYDNEIDAHLAYKQELKQ